MKICGEILQFMKDNNMAEFQTLKALFLYHSNKIEGSTFSYENLIKAIDKSVIEGNHSYEDVIETMNSTLGNTSQFLQPPFRIIISVILHKKPRLYFDKDCVFYTI